jgi:hypothetical protein
MEAAAKVLPEKFVELMRVQMEEYLRDVIQAVNAAPDGDWIAGSEEQVRDLSAAFRQQVYQQALQQRVDAAEAAFPPSGGVAERPAAGQ